MMSSNNNGIEEIVGAIDTENLANGCVGALDHVLRKTFKELYQDEEVKEEVEGKQLQEEDKNEGKQDDESTEQECAEEKVNEPLADNEEEEEQPVNEEKEPVEESLEEQPEVAETSEQGDEGSVDKVVSEEQLIVSSNPTVAKELYEIEANLTSKLSDAKKLQVYLERQRIAAELEDKREVEEIYKQGLLVGAEYPLGRSHHSLSEKKLDSFGTFSSNLLFARHLMDENEESDQYRRGQIKRGVGDVCQIRPSTPNYQKVKKREEDEEVEQKNERKRQAPRPKKRQELSTTEKKARNDMLARMKKPIAFLKNPRFTVTSRANRDWHLSLLNEDRSEPATFSQKELLRLEEEAQRGFIDELIPPRPEFKRKRGDIDPTTRFSFRVEPSHARFTGNYKVNQVNECTLNFYNVSSVSKGLRFLPPTTKYFSIVKTEFPTTTAIVAPGMACVVTVAFCPDSLADYSDFLTVCTETERFRVALVAKRTPPRLTLPQTLDVGCCFVGDEIRQEFPFENIGGEAKFQLLSEADWKSPDESIDYSKREFLQIGAFKLSPVQLAMANGDRETISISFTPNGCGEYESEFVMVCDNCQVQRIKLRGMSCKVQIEISSLDGTNLIPDNLPVKPLRSIIFDPTTIGAYEEHQFTYRNVTPIALQFHWELFCKAANRKKKKRHHHGDLVHVKKTGDVPMVFSIQPNAGVLRPHEDYLFTVRCTPRNSKLVQQVAHLVVEDIPPTAVDSAENEEKLSGGRTKDITCSKLVLSGRGIAPVVQVLPSPVKRFPSECYVGEEYSVQVSLRNTSTNDASVKFEWQESCNPDVSFKPSRSTGTIGLNQEVDLAFTVKANKPGWFSETLQCNLFSGNSSSSTGKATFSIGGLAIGPQIQILNKEVDFGLVGVNLSTSATFAVKNKSTIPATVFFENITEPLLFEPVRGASAKVAIEPESVTIPPLGSTDVSVQVCAGNAPERLRKVFKAFTSFSRTEGAQYVKLRAEIQSPTVFIEVSDTTSGGKCSMDLGVTYVTVPSTKTVRMVNLSNLDAKFSWTTLLNTSSTAYDVVFSDANGVLLPKEERLIQVTYVAKKPGRYSSLFLCEVEGMAQPLGFVLKTLSRGLIVTYALVDDSVKPADMVPFRPDSRNDDDTKEAVTVTNDNVKFPVLDFGSNVELCRRKVLRVCFTNHSAIKTDIQLRLRSHEAEVIPPSLAAACSSSLTSASQGLLSVDEDGITLSDTAEQVGVYKSEMGRQYITVKLQQKEDKDVLKNGDGIAFLCCPSTQTLAPWSSIIVDFVCFNNMPGRYKTELLCDIEGLSSTSAPVKVNVVGSPLKLFGNTVGLVLKDKKKEGKDEEDGELTFGHCLVGTGEVHKIIKVTNEGPIDSLLSWRVKSRRSRDADLVESTIRFDEEAMKQDKNKRIVFSVSPHSELTSAPPFVVNPVEQLVKAHSVASFRVSYKPNNGAESDDLAIMVADSQWLDGEHGMLKDSRSSKSLGSSSSHATFQSLVSATVLEGDSISDAQNATESETSSQAHLQNKTKRDSLRGFLSVELKSRSVKPALTLDRHHRGESLTQYLGFVCHSTKPLDSSCFFKTITFTNKLPSDLPCVIGIDPPFYIKDCKTSSSSSSSSGLASEQSKALKAMERDKKVDGRRLCLPPGAICAITIQFRPPKRPKAEVVDVNSELRQTSKGNLNIYFINGDQQTVDLEGTLVKPMVACYPPLYDFGHVHVETAQQTVVKLTNPTVVAAKWRIEHIVNGENDTGNKVDDPSCWTFDIDHGVLKGPTLPLTSSNAFMPQGFDSSGKRLPVPIHVCFSPSLQVQYESRFRITVENGVSFNLLLRGNGSYNEEDHNRVLPLPFAS